MFEDVLQLPNLFLHAERLEFIHPITESPISIHAKRPQFWEDFMNKISNYIIN